MQAEMQLQSISEESKSRAQSVIYSEMEVEKSSPLKERDIQDNEFTQVVVKEPSPKKKEDTDPLLMEKVKKARREVELR